MASKSGDLINVGPKTIPRFSLDMRFSFSYWVTLRGREGTADVEVRLCRPLSPPPKKKKSTWQAVYLLRCAMRYRNDSQCAGGRSFRASWRDSRRFSGSVTSATGERKNTHKDIECVVV